MPFRLVLSALTSAALVATPLAAQANTRAAGSSIALAPIPARVLEQAAGAADLGRNDCDDDGIVNPADDDSGCGKGLSWLVFGGVGIAVIALLFAAGGSGQPPARSPGT